MLIIAFSYNRLWKLLIDKKMTKTQLKDAAKLSNSSLARISKNNNVTTDILNRICKTLECELEDIIEYIPENK